MRTWTQSRAILSNFVEEQWTQNYPQYLSALSRELYPTTFLETAVYIELPSGHKCLCVEFIIVLKPPNYMEADLIDHLSDDMADDFLQLNPEGLFVCGGDLNRLNLDELTDVSGLKVLVDFLTRGTHIIDNCLTNKAIVFSKCYPIAA